MQISLIITSYNRPDALFIVLKSVERQSQIPNEIIIADDGSDERTRKIITNFSIIYFFDKFGIKFEPKKPEEPVIKTLCIFIIDLINLYNY